MAEPLLSPGTKGDSFFPPVTGSTPAPSTAVGPVSAETDVLLNEYRTLRQQIRDSSAAVIQARFRGYLARKPIASTAGPDAQLDSLHRSLRFIQTQRREAKPPRVLPMAGWSMAQLSAEKRCLKTILSNHQTRLARKLGRAPTRADKEGYRPIYKLYREVKDLIAAESAVAAHSGGGPTLERAPTQSPDPADGDSLDSPPSLGGTRHQTRTATVDKKGVASAPPGSTAATASPAAPATGTGARPAGAGVIASGGRRGLNQARRSQEGLAQLANTGIASAPVVSTAPSKTSAPSTTSAQPAAASTLAAAAGKRYAATPDVSPVAGSGQLLDSALHVGAGMVGGLLVPTAMPTVGGAQRKDEAKTRASASPASHAVDDLGMVAGGGGLSGMEPLNAAQAMAARRSVAQEAPASPLKVAVLERMRAEKRSLQIKLNRFEQTFRQLKGRPIKYAKDIAPVRAGNAQSTSPSPYA